MCGLVGLFGLSLSANDAKVLKNLLYLDFLRGRHSTGIGIVGNSGKRKAQYLVKALGHPSKLYTRYPYLFDNNGNLTMKSGFTSKLWLGHNRHATLGAVNAQNAHPFLCGSILGTHNGTIRSGLPTILEGRSDATDSEKLYSKLDDKKGDLEEACEGVVGAAALAYWDSNDETFNLYHNSERPLHYCWSTTGSRILYASTKWAISGAIEVNKDTALYKSEIEEVPIDTWLKFKTVGTKVEIVQQKKVELRPKFSPSSRITTIGGTMYRGNTSANRGTLPAVYKPGFMAPKKGGVPANFSSGSSTGWFDALTKLSATEYARQIDLGCAYCEQPIDYLDEYYGRSFWLDENRPLCSCCSKDWK